MFKELTGEAMEIKITHVTGLKKLARTYKSKLRQRRKEAIQTQAAKKSGASSSYVVQLRKASREYKKKLRGI